MRPNVHVLSQTSSVVHQFLAEMRSTEVQTDRQRFRLNLERLGEVMAYEISRQLPYISTEITTPLGTLMQPVLAQQPVLATVLRAALPMHQGFLRMFDGADSAFISAYRRHTRANEFVIQVEYVAAPDLENRSLILLDPMIATGQSMVLSYEALSNYGKPSQLFIVGAIASEQGLDYVCKHLPQAQVWVGAVDSELTAKAYIVPGLGDAGDLAFGAKN